MNRSSKTSARTRSLDFWQCRFFTPVILFFLLMLIITSQKTYAGGHQSDGNYRDYVRCLAENYIKRARRTPTYYVDPLLGSSSNPGTQAQPWDSIATAKAHVVPGDVVQLAKGIYANDDWGENTPGGRPGFPIVWQAACDGDAKIRYTSGRNHHVWEGPLMHNIFIGIDVDGEAILNVSRISSWINGKNSEISHCQWINCKMKRAKGWNCISFSANSRRNIFVGGEYDTCGRPDMGGDSDQGDLINLLPGSVDIVANSLRLSRGGHNLLVGRSLNTYVVGSDFDQDWSQRPEDPEGLYDDFFGNRYRAVELMTEAENTVLAGNIYRNTGRVRNDLRNPAIKLRGTGTMVAYSGFMDHNGTWQVVRSDTGKKAAFRKVIDCALVHNSFAKLDSGLVRLRATDYGGGNMDPSTAEWERYLILNNAVENYFNDPDSNHYPKVFWQNTGVVSTWIPDQWVAGNQFDLVNGAEPPAEVVPNSADSFGQYEIDYPEFFADNQVGAPLFVNALTPTTAADLKLQRGSPCAGTAAALCRVTQVISATEIIVDRPQALFGDSFRPDLAPGMPVKVKWVNARIISVDKHTGKVRLSRPVRRIRCGDALYARARNRGMYQRGGHCKRCDPPRIPYLPSGIQCGDSDPFTTITGVRFEADYGSAGGHREVSVEEIFGTEDDALYQNSLAAGQQDHITYRILTPKWVTVMEIIGHFNEHVHEAEGLRLVDVAIRCPGSEEPWNSGVLVEDGLDIFAEAGGRNTALVRSWGPVDISGGELEITVSASPGGPDAGLISAIEFKR